MASVCWYESRNRNTDDSEYIVFYAMVDMVGCMKERATKNEIYICVRSICLRCVCLCERALRLSLSVEYMNLLPLLYVIVVQCTYGVWFGEHNQFQTFKLLKMVEKSVRVCILSNIVAIWFSETVAKERNSYVFIFLSLFSNESKYFISNTQRAFTHRFRGQQQLSTFSSFSAFLPSQWQEI